MNSMTMDTINEDNSFTGGLSTSSMNTGYVSRSTTRCDIHGRPFDVDSRAESDLKSMGESRQQAIEMITEDRARLADRCDALEKQKSASKARIKSLESENSRQREQMKTLIEKTDSDDQLVNALRQELDRLKVASRKAIQDVRIQAQETVPKSVRVDSDGKTHNSSSPLMSKFNPNPLDSEVKRLTRLNQTQADQMKTQEDVIKGLRKRVNACSCDVSSKIVTSK